ncbi:MAG: ABC transporter permease [Bacilli bacterium]
MAAIVRMWFITQWRSVSAILTMLVLPVALVYVFGYLPSAKSSDVMVAVVRHDSSPVAGAAITWLSRIDHATVQVVAQTQADREFAQGVAAFAVDVGARFTSDVVYGRPADLTIASVPVSASQVLSRGSPVRIALRAALAKGHLAAARVLAAGGDYAMAERAGARAILSAPTLLGSDVHVAYRSQGAGATLSPVQFSVLGFMEVFVAIRVFGSVQQLLEARKAGIWRRLIAAAGKPVPVIAAYTFSFLLEGLLQFALLMAADHVLFGVSFHHMGYVGVVAFLYVASMVGMAFLLTLWVTNPRQFSQISSVAAMGFGMLGGLFWPLSIEPAWLQKMADFLPQHWALDGFQMAALGIGLHTAFWLPCLVLAGFSALFLTAGAARLRFE